ncbi:Chloramphenicol acetyltransferase [compost metagenome]
MVGGNPCKQIRWRFDEDVRNILLESAWWDWPMDEVKAVSRMLSSSDLDSFLAYIKARNG